MQPCLEIGTRGAIKTAFIRGWEGSFESLASLLHRHHHPVLLPLVFFPPILTEMLQGFSGLSVWLQELGVKCLLSMQFYKTQGKQVWQVWLSYHRFPYHRTRRLVQEMRKECAHILPDKGVQRDCKQSLSQGLAGLISLPASSFPSGNLFAGGIWVLSTSIQDWWMASRLSREHSLEFPDTFTLCVSNKGTVHLH